jgi:hypothetical protein
MHHINTISTKNTPQTRFLLGSPITHLILRMLFATMVGNSSLDSAQGFSIALKFWWHLTFLDKNIQCSLCFGRDNSDGMLISINFLEFALVIINYCAALHIIKTTPITENPHPVLLKTSRTMCLPQLRPSTCVIVPSLVACLLVSLDHC